MAPPMVPIVPPPTAAPMAAPEAAPTVSACEAHPARPASEATTAITILALNISASVEMGGLEQRSMLQSVFDCYQSLRVQLELAVDLHRDAARKRHVAHRGARVLAVFRAPQFEEEVGSAVDDLGRLREVRRAVHHAEKAQHALDAIEVASVRF